MFFSRSMAPKQVMEPTRAEVRKDQFSFLSKRELKSTKIHAPHYHPTGGKFPKQGTSPAEVRENIQYLESELVRWYESLAWVSDDASIRNDAVSRTL